MRARLSMCQGEATALLTPSGLERNPFSLAHIQQR